MFVTIPYVSLILPPSVSSPHSNQRIFLELQSGHTLLMLQHPHTCCQDKAPSPGCSLPNQCHLRPLPSQPPLPPPLLSSLCAVISHFIGPQGLCLCCSLGLPAPLAQQSTLLILESNATFLGSLPLTFSQDFPSYICQFIVIYDLWDYLMNVRVHSSNMSLSSPLRAQA